MTAITVVDASAVCAVILDDPEGEALVPQIDGAMLAAPTLIFFEVANVCVTRMRRRPDLKAAHLAAFERFTRLPIETRPVSWPAVIALAADHGLTAYDASYFWLARELGAPLLTLDRQLARAAAAL